MHVESLPEVSTIQFSLLFLLVHVESLPEVSTFQFSLLFLLVHVESLPEVGFELYLCDPMPSRAGYLLVTCGLWNPKGAVTCAFKILRCLTCVHLFLHVV